MSLACWNLAEGRVIFLVIICSKVNVSAKPRTWIPHQGSNLGTMSILNRILTYYPKNIDCSSLGLETVRAPKDHINIRI